MGYYAARNFYEEPAIDGEGHAGYRFLLLTAPAAHPELLHGLYIFGCQPPNKAHWNSKP